LGSSFPRPGTIAYMFQGLATKSYVSALNSLRDGTLGLSHREPRATPRQRRSLASIVRRSKVGRIRERP